MPQAEQKRFTVLVRANGETLGPFATRKEAEDCGNDARERAVVEWSRHLLGRLIKEPELMRKIVALLALAPFEEERWKKPGPLATLTGLSRPNEWFMIQEAGEPGEGLGNQPYPVDAYRERMLAAILALDLDKE